jgi:hypothetical protein
MAHGTLIHGLVDFLLGVTNHLRPQKIATNSIYVEHRNFLTMRNNNKKRPEPNTREEKAREVSEIRDVMSQTTET